MLRPKSNGEVRPLASSFLMVKEQARFYGLARGTNEKKKKISDVSNSVNYYVIGVRGSVHHSKIHTEKSNKMQQCIKILLFHTRSVNKVMRLPAYRTIWQYCGLALHIKVR
jgi:hypothetical protein